jgi:hypothetical protein
MSPQKNQPAHLFEARSSVISFGKAAQISGGAARRNPSDGAYDAVRLLKVASAIDLVDEQSAFICEDQRPNFSGILSV